MSISVAGSTRIPAKRIGRIVKAYRKGRTEESSGPGDVTNNADGGQPQATAGGGADTPPSNTVSANSNSSSPSFLALRWGVDSLYLSYLGRLSMHRAEDLTRLKEAARSGVAGEIANAQLRLGGHIFEVRDKGAGLFPFVLEDNAYRISLASV